MASDNFASEPTPIFCGSPHCHPASFQETDFCRMLCPHRAVWHAQDSATLGDARTLNEKITKLAEQTVIYKKNVICLVPPNPQRPRPCQTTSRSTCRGTKHNTNGCTNGGDGVMIIGKEVHQATPHFFVAYCETGAIRIMH